MSQEKVDKRKYEKQHRKQIEKKRKIKTALIVIGCALVIGAIIGFPIGYFYYNKHKEDAALDQLYDMLSTTTEATTTEATDGSGEGSDDSEATDDSESTDESSETTEATEDSETDTTEE